MNAIAPNAPIGASFVTMCTMPNSTRVSPSMKSVTTLPRSPRCASTLPNSSAISRICRISPCANASTIVFGMMCIRKSTVDCPCAFAAYDATALPSSVAGSMLKPTPGRRMCVAARPSTSAKVDTISKYSSALPPTRPTFFMSSMPAMPVTTVQKMIGPITILISLMKPSPSGFMSVAIDG